MLYKSIIRPLLFRMRPEQAHRFTFAFLKFTNYIPLLRAFIRNRYQFEETQLICKGIVCKNRIGLSAGMDKGAEVFNELADYGFGFIEVGTVTPDPCEGNPRPRIFRLPKCDALITRTGFNNPGLKTVKERLAHRAGRVTLGVNINKNPQSTGQQAVDELLHMLTELSTRADYFTLNWGSMDAPLMEQVLTALVERRASLPMRRPILLKLPGDITPEGMDEVLATIARHGLDGVIATGPTTDRSLLRRYTKAELEAIGSGGVSGKAMGLKSYFAVDYLRKHGGPDLLIIGAGGVMTPADAERMIRMGADFVQIYSAFIYEGPGIVPQMVVRVGEME